MNISPEKPVSSERAVATMYGWAILALNLLMWLASPFFFVLAVRDASIAIILASVLWALATAIISGGFFTLQPNEARVLVLFGEYRGTERTSGFHCTNPFIKKLPI